MGEIVRFAPSPTGYLHLGHGYSAWFTQEQGDRVLLRIEDTDRDRARGEYTMAIFEDLAWLGFEWEGEVWRQSERVQVYDLALRRLQEMGLIYRCFCSRKQVGDEGLRVVDGFGAVYGGRCRGLQEDEVRRAMEGAERWNWRLDTARCRVMFGELEWVDRAKGRQVAEVGFGGDPVIGNDQSALYHLAVVVDDAAQGISLVTRGMDVFVMTHIHRYLQEALGLEVPEYWHHGLVLGEDGKKLSKREGAMGLRELRERGLSGNEAVELAFRMISQDVG